MESKKLKRTSDIRAGDLVRLPNGNVANVHGIILLNKRFYAVFRKGFHSSQIPLDEVTKIGEEGE